MVIGLISRLTNQKGLDLVNDVIPGIMDGNTQVVVLGTGDAQYEDTFRFMKINIKAASVPILPTMKMWLIIFMQCVMRF